ncbi:MAG: SDR family oxidoreductase [Chthonomonadaceae bacterium]|nr:SDR family oxidoreductase [Chthonomonadaceae bacterium]
MSKVVLITGGSSGIGLSAAGKLLAEGHQVAICGRSVEKLEAAIAKLEPDDAHFKAMQADVTDSAHIASLIERTIEKFGRIDVLVNSAGAGYLGAFAETTEEIMDRLWNVNVKGAMLSTQAVLPGMTSQKSGQIINLCGILGVKTIANAALYCATKHALVGFGSALATELKRANIRVTSLCCSGVDSPFWDGVPGKPRPELLLQPAEVADEILALIRQPDHIITNTVLLQHVLHQM